MYLENNVFFEFHPFVFYVKDLIWGCFFSAGVEIVFTLCLNLLPPHCYKPSCLHIFLPLLISGIIDLGTLVRVFLVFMSNKKVSCILKHFHFDCQACSLGKSSRLSWRPTSHKTSTPLELSFSDVWGPSFMLSYDGFQYFFIFMNVHMKYIWFFFLWMQNLMFLWFFLSISNSSWTPVLFKN